MGHLTGQGTLEIASMLHLKQASHYFYPMTSGMEELS